METTKSQTNSKIASLNDANKTKILTSKCFTWLVIVTMVMLWCLPLIIDSFRLFRYLKSRKNSIRGDKNHISGINLPQKNESLGSIYNKVRQNDIIIAKKIQDITRKSVCDEYVVQFE